jgi:hypothetical protein
MPSETRRADSVSFADFTETTLAAVAKVIDARKIRDRDIPLGPVLIGLVWWPEGGPVPVLPPNPIKSR